MKSFLMVCLALVGISIGLSNDSLAQRGQRGGADGAPKIGDPAPDFKLKSLDGKSETQLSAFKDKKPVVLFFGSYT